MGKDTTVFSMEIVFIYRRYAILIKNDQCLCSERVTNDFVSFQWQSLWKVIRSNGACRDRWDRTSFPALYITLLCDLKRQMPKARSVVRAQRLLALCSLLRSRIG